jgi:hypothetical protein
MPNAKANGGSGGFRWTTDPTFYPTARSAIEVPPEKLAYVAALAPDQKARPDALLVVDVDPASATYGLPALGWAVPFAWPRRPWSGSGCSGCGATGTRSGSACR